MNNSQEIDGNIKGSGGGDVGNAGSEAQGGSEPADADAGVPRPGMGKGAEWTIVTRANGKRPKAAAARSGTKGTDGSGFFLQFQGAADQESAKKRRAEETLDESLKTLTMADQIEGLRRLVLQLIQNQQEAADQQQKVATQQAQEIAELKRMIQTDNVRRPSYAEKAQANGEKRGQTADKPARPAPQPQRVNMEDDKRSITINVAQVKGEKEDFAEVKKKLQSAMDSVKELKQARIICLRQLPGSRINVVFATEEEATRAKKHSQWLSTAMPGARPKTEAWYPIKCDSVPKRAVLDSTGEDKKTLRREVGEEFSRDNSIDGDKCEVMRATWLSKDVAEKKAGSMVVWLKSKLSAERLLASGSVLFGAYGSFCSRYIQTEAQGTCYNCNTYGHKQAACKRPKRCGTCAGPHDTRECTNSAHPKCAVCAGTHTVRDWACPRHPQHKRFLAKQKTPQQTDISRIGRAAEATAMEVDTSIDQ